MQARLALWALNVPDIFFDFAAAHFHLVSTLVTAQFKVHAAAQHGEHIAATGMRFFHGQFIAHADIHVASLLSPCDNNPK